MVKDHRLETGQINQSDEERGKGCSQSKDDSLNNSCFPALKPGCVGKERRGDCPQLRGMWSTDDSRDPETKPCHEVAGQKEEVLQNRETANHEQRSEETKVHPSEADQDAWSQLQGVWSDDSDLMAASNSLHTEEDEAGWSQLKGVWSDEGGQKVKPNRGVLERKEDCSQLRGEWPASRFRGLASKPGHHVEDDRSGWSQLKGVWSDDSSQGARSNRGGVGRKEDCSQLRGEWPASRFQGAISKPEHHIEDDQDGWSQLKDVWADDSSARSKSSRGVAGQKEDCSQLRGEWPASRFQGAFSNTGHPIEVDQNGLGQFKGGSSVSSLGSGTKTLSAGANDRNDCSQLRGEWPASRFQKSESKAGKEVVDRNDSSQHRSEWASSRFQISESNPGKGMVADRKEDASQRRDGNDLSDGDKDKRK